MPSHLYPIYFYEFYLLLPFLVLQKRIFLKTKRPVHYINTNNTFQKNISIQAFAVWIYYLFYPA